MPYFLYSFLLYESVSLMNESMIFPDSQCHTITLHFPVEACRQWGCFEQLFSVLRNYTVIG